MNIGKNIGIRHIGLRFNSNLSKSIPISEITPQLSNKRIYFYALPITTRKTFIHCKYNNDIFPNGKETLENKLINKFTTIWKNFSTSDASINKKVVKIINQVLSKIPWLETCLLSIPSQKFITRKLREDKEREEKSEFKSESKSESQTTSFVTHDTIISKNLKSEDLEQFDYYYPKGLTNSKIMLETFRPEFKQQYEIHRKGIYKDLLLMPLTIPFALVPLLPNIPGFYLLYRIYCHIKVIASLKFLIGLLKDLHFKFHEVDNLTEIYLSTNDIKIQSNVLEHLALINENNFNSLDNPNDIEGKFLEMDEKLLISKDVAEKLCEVFDDKECTEKLMFAIEQESKHLADREAKNVNDE